MCLLLEALQPGVTHPWTPQKHKHASCLYLSWEMLILTERSLGAHTQTAATLVLNNDPVCCIAKPLCRGSVGNFGTSLQKVSIDHCQRLWLIQLWLTRWMDFLTGLILRSQRTLAPRQTDKPWQTVQIVRYWWRLFEEKINIQVCE